MNYSNLLKNYEKTLNGMKPETLRKAELNQRETCNSKTKSINTGLPYDPRIIDAREFECEKLHMIQKKLKPKGWLWGGANNNENINAVINILKSEENGVAALAAVLGEADYDLLTKILKILDEIQLATLLQLKEEELASYNSPSISPREAGPKKINVTSQINAIKLEQASRQSYFSRAKARAKGWFSRAGRTKRTRRAKRNRRTRRK